MGTSASSSGPGSGVPLVPPWVPDPEDRDEVAKRDPDADATPTDSQTAPAARFGGARRALGDFARTGSDAVLRKGLGRYVSKGLGGTGRAARRMGAASVRSGDLYGVLHALGGGPPLAGQLEFDASRLAGQSPKQIIDAIAQLVSPSDGSQDAESSRHAISAALSDLLSEDDNADLTKLTELQIDWVVERHLAYEIHNRVELDVGKAVLDNAPSYATAMRRLDEIRSYIQEKVAAAFRARRQSERAMSTKDATELANRVVRDTFEVFEEYVQ